MKHISGSAPPLRSMPAQICAQDFDRGGGVIVHGNNNTGAARRGLVFEVGLPIHLQMLERTGVAFPLRARMGEEHKWERNEEVICIVHRLIVSKVAMQTAIEAALTNRIHSTLQSLWNTAWWRLSTLSRPPS